METEWWNGECRDVFPYPLLELRKECSLLAPTQGPLETNVDDEPVSEKLYNDYYRPFEMTTLSELFLIKEASHSVKDFMPNCCTDYRYHQLSQMRSTIF